MKPPNTLNVLDSHGGFTADTTRMETPWNSGARGKTPSRFDMKARRARAGGRLTTNTVWRPGDVLPGTTTGTLLDYDEDSFYQTNRNVTMAFYRVRGYGWPIVVWFDNATHRRIA